MDFVIILLLMGAVFGICFLVDKGFTKIFRNKSQHYSGLSVRLSKKYGAGGVIMIVLGLAGIFSGLSGTWLLIAAGALILVVGIGLVVYYMTFGLFYDKDAFVMTTFGKKSTVYGFSNIKCQQLYSNSGSIIIELEMNDGRCVQLQSGMIGVYPFLDAAFEGWCRQKNIDPESCSFHDPDNSLWFPMREES